jgi:polar amino acid transport system substrate-binding protein
MESADPNNPGTFIGADVDLAQALAKQMGLKGATIKNAGFDSLIPSLNANRFDAVMSSMNDTPERRKSVEFVDYMTATEAILVKKSAPIRANSYSGLCGKSVAVERGTTEQDGLNAANQSCSSKINIQAFPGDSDAYQAFKSGHTDAYTSDLPVIAHYVSTNPGVYQMAGKAMSAHANYGIAVRKGNTVLKNALSSALAKLRANGQYMKILKKWNVADAALKS